MLPECTILFVFKMTISLDERTVSLCNTLFPSLVLFFPSALGLMNWSMVVILPCAPWALWVKFRGSNHSTLFPSPYSPPALCVPFRLSCVLTLWDRIQLASNLLCLSSREKRSFAGGFVGILGRFWSLSATTTSIQPVGMIFRCIVRLPKRRVFFFLK